jgi:hypothetical protein
MLLDARLRLLLKGGVGVLGWERVYRWLCRVVDRQIHCIAVGVFRWGTGGCMSNDLLGFRICVYEVEIVEWS